MNAETLKERKNVLRSKMPENAICCPREIREDTNKSATNTMDIILTWEENDIVNYVEVTRLYAKF